jgi:pimeloyl-ACP methyl ester carboxylesterase
MRWWILLWMGLICALPWTNAVQAQDQGTRTPTRELLANAGATPCTPESQFLCVTLTVLAAAAEPLNAVDAARTIDVVFAVRPADGERRGMLVTVVGGPGSSGIQDAEWQLDGYSPQVLQHFDLVYFDQRGIGRSSPLECSLAQLNYFVSNGDPTTTIGRGVLIAAAREYAQNCAASSNRPWFVPYLGTRYAIEDLEAFRRFMGDEQFYLYGQSYGTRYGQVFATFHPESLAGLILDGVVDMTQTREQAYIQQALAFNRVLTDTMNACNLDEECVNAFGGNPLKGLERVVERLKQGPVIVQLPTPYGIDQRQFFYQNFDSLVSGALYTETRRGPLLRAIAFAAVRNDYSQLLRMYYAENGFPSSNATDGRALLGMAANVGLDALLRSRPMDDAEDDGFSNIAFQAINCGDYAYTTGTLEEKIDGLFALQAQVNRLNPYLAGYVLGDLPCLFWPTAARLEPYAPLTAEGIPTFILDATFDPATPYVNSEAVFGRLADGYRFTMEGGPHVIYGRDGTCPDDAVNAFLLEGVLPANRVNTCEGLAFDRFAPPPPLDAAVFRDPLVAMDSLIENTRFTPDYIVRDVETPIFSTCGTSGVFYVEVLPDESERWTYSACSFSEGFVFDGSGRRADGQISVAGIVSGLATGSVIYTLDTESEASTLQGTYNGASVSLSR